jgi:hypothetical protein
VFYSPCVYDTGRTGSAGGPWSPGRARGRELVELAPWSVELAPGRGARGLNRGVISRKPAPGRGRLALIRELVAAELVAVYVIPGPDKQTTNKQTPTNKHEPRAVVRGPRDEIPGPVEGGGVPAPILDSTRPARHAPRKTARGWSREGFSLISYKQLWGKRESVSGH